MFYRLFENISLIKSKSMDHNSWKSYVSSCFKCLAAKIVFNFEFNYQKYKMRIQTVKKLLLN